MSGNSEGGRIARILENAQRCSIQENLARARAYQGKDSCVPCKSYNYLGNTNIPSESSYLALRPKCFTYVREPVVPESIRIARVQEAVLSNQTDPMNSNTRFSDYAPNPTIVGCPPITYSNGSIPQRCPLLNTPLNPVL
jgi:hypothetical protein